MSRLLSYRLRHGNPRRERLTVITMQYGAEWVPLAEAARWRARRTHCRYWAQAGLLRLKCQSANSRGSRFSHWRDRANMYWISACDAPSPRSVSPTQRNEGTDRSRGRSTEHGEYAPVIHVNDGATALPPQPEPGDDHAQTCAQAPPSRSELAPAQPVDTAEQPSGPAVPLGAVPLAAPCTGDNGIDGDASTHDFDPDAPCTLR